MRKQLVADALFVVCVGVAGYGLWHFSPSVTLILAGVLGMAAVIVFGGRK